MKVDTINITNNANFKMIVFNNTSVGVQFDGIVTAVDGKGNQVVTKTSKPFFTPHRILDDHMVKRVIAGELS